MSDDRVPVTTRVPGYQKEAWLDDADDLDMSQSEFVRTMVQAGRRELGLSDGAAAPSNGESRESPGGEEVPRANGSVEGGSGDVTPGVDALEDRVLDILDERGVCSWDELLDAVVGDFEERLDETMGELQESGRIRYSGREGGYVRNE